MRTRTVPLFLFLTVAMSLRADQFDNLRLYRQTYLINQGGGIANITNTANGYWNSMETSPSRTELWSYLPFGSSSDAESINGTFGNLQAMALAWATPGCALYGNTSLASAVTNGLDWMNANIYTKTASELGNWFCWEDSGPMNLGDAMVLIYPQLTGTQISNYCAAMDHFGPVGHGTAGNASTYGWMTGANTSDKILVMLLEGIVSRNTNSMVTMQTNFSSLLIYANTSDGFYTDGSYVFHSVIAYNGHYGDVELGDIPQIVDLLQVSTDWKITDPNLANVYAWVTNSFEPFIYNGAMMDSVRGRIVSWSYETESERGADTISDALQIAQFAPTNVAVAISNWANAKQVPPGQYQFSSMDRAVAWRTNFTFAISMSSSRIANYESINSGNLHGWHQGDGMTYLYVGNSENQFNSDFWPTVDPYHLPGTTAETNSLLDSTNQTTTTSQNWVGGAQVAKTYGVAGMSVAAIKTSLVAKKSWFMLDNEIVCLGAGITCGDGAGADTTAESRRLGTISQSFTLNGKAITPTVGMVSNLPSGTASNWCSLSGTVSGTNGYYFPPGNSNLLAMFTQNSGSWSQINSGDSSANNTDYYFQLRYNHGVHPTNTTYSYVILPNTTTTTVSNYALAPDITILTNTPFVQAVKKSTLGVVAANFWTNGTQTADLISVNNKASVITLESVNGIAVGVSDPTQTNTSYITVTLNRSASGLLSADAGVLVQQLSPQIIFKVKANGSLGKAFQASFTYTGTGIPYIPTVYPDGANVLQSTNTLAFNVVSGFGVPTNGVVVTLNGVQAPILVFNGAATNWNVSCPCLLPNMVYTAVITVTDTQGNVVTTTSSFDTFNAANYTVEAEDFDYTGGHFFDALQTNAYAGLRAYTNIDTHQVNFGGTFLYRPTGMDTEVNGDAVRPQYNGTGKTDYSMGYFSAGAWANYTRHYPSGSYNVYARLAAGSAATMCALSQVTGGWGTTNQTTNQLGTFSVPLTAWESYNYIPLLDGSGNLVTVTFDGSTNTLQLSRPIATADCNANYLMLVPIFAANAVQTGTNVVVSFPTESGFNYQVWYKNSLTDASWSPLSTVAGNNTVQSVNDPATNNAHFYKVQVE